MKLINECLDVGDWPEDAHGRLQAIETSVWYPLEEEANTSMDSSKSKSKKSKSKAKRKSNDTDNASPEAKRPKSKEEDQWKTDITQSMAALTSLVTQFVAKAPQTSQEAPPVPPRSQEQTQLIEDVRHFIAQNQSTPAQSEKSDASLTLLKTVQVSEPESSLPKQRPLPSGRIPKRTLPSRNRVAGNSSGEPAFQFSTTYHDYEEYGEDQSDNEIVDSDQDRLDQDPDPLAVDMDLGRLEKRKMHLAGLEKMCPDLKVTQPSVPTSGRFGLLRPKPKENVMPFLTEMFEQISLNSVVRERRPKDPFAMLPRFYPTSEPAESGILQGRHVPRELVDLVPNSKLIKPGASGRKAILTNSLADGARDQAAQNSFKQACGYIRLANNFEIDVEVMQNLMGQIGSIVSDLDKVRDLPVVAQGKVLQLSQKVRLMNRTIFDVKSTNADLARGSLYQYQSALFDRRSAWVSASMVLKGTSAELKGADYPRPSHQDSVGRLDMFGPEGTKVLKEYDVLAKEGKVPTPQSNYQNNRSQNQSRRGQYSGQYYQPQNYNQSRGGHGYGQRSRGSRPSNRRGRNNYQGNRGNRGAYNPQPFSQATKPQRKD
jgi:hypothetical protein